MTHWTEAADLLDARNPAQPGPFMRHAPGAFAFLMSAALGVYLVFLRPVVFAPAPQLAVVPQAPEKAAPHAVFGGVAPFTPAPSLPVAGKPEGNPFGALELKGFQPDTQVATDETPAPTPPVPPPDLRAPNVAQSAADVPLPPRRPSELLRESVAPARVAETPPPRPSEPAVARVEPRPVATLAPAAAPNVFEKLFGAAPANPGRPQQEARLAYAAPPPASTSLAAAPAGRGGPIGGGFLHGLTFGDSAPSTRFGDHAAIYDISAHVVILPDGTRLEAHSGLGEFRDDPSRVNERMRGPTPPATYALTLREGSFHGVEALRLTPLDSGVFGRAGLLAHTYMLGPNGDSNGCVSFRDYQAFLRAYRNGQINKLVVVTRL